MGSGRVANARWERIQFNTKCKGSANTWKKQQVSVGRVISERIAAQTARYCSKVLSIYCKFIILKLTKGSAKEDIYN